MNAALRHMSISDVATNMASQHHETWLAGTYWASSFNKPAGDGPAGFFWLERISALAVFLCYAVRFNKRQGFE
jgi:hypothetical protein